MLKTVSNSGGGSGTSGRTLLTGDKTLYVRTPAHAVTFTNASANIGWATHGLSVNDAVVLSILPSTGTATVTIASPGLFAKIGHGYVAGQPLRVDTDGALPTGLTAGGTVYVIAAGLTADNFEVSLAVGGAAVNTSGTQSGTHYVSQVGAMPTFSTVGAAAWNPATKQADLTLSNGNLTGTTLQGANYAYAGGTASKGAGLLYLEFTPSFTTNKSNDEAIVGVTDGDPSTNQYGLTSSGNLIHNGVFVGPVGTAYNSAEVVGVAINQTTGKGWFRNSIGWAGDPVAGTGEAFTFTPGTPLAAWMDVYSNAPPAPASVTVNFGATIFAYAVPNGFTAFGKGPALLTEGHAYQVASVVDVNTITLKDGGVAIGTATVATGAPVYSANTGSDSNDGSAADRAHALLTRSGAQHILTSVLDVGGDPAVRVTVQHAASVYSEAVTYAGLTGSPGQSYDNYNGVYLPPPVIIRGDPTTLASTSNVIFQTAPASQVPPVTLTGSEAVYTFDGVTVDSSTGDDFVDAVDVVDGARLLVGDFILKSTGNNLGFVAIDGSWIEGFDNTKSLTLIGSKRIAFSNVDSYVDASRWASINLLTSSWGGAFVSSFGVYAANYFGPNFTGTATGKRFNLGYSASAITGGQGLAFLPGSTAGTATLGASYDGQRFATATNDAALTGTVGEFISAYVASGAAVALSNNTPANVASVSLPAGDWDVEGNINFAGAAATITAGVGGISATSATVPTDGSEVNDGTLTTVATDVSGITLPRKRISIAATTTVYLVAQKTFSAGSVSAYGGITARRAR